MMKLLILGASIAQIPFIKTAKSLSCIVALVDYNNQAPAIEFADLYYECSLLDVDGIRKICLEFEPDGITCGASDVGVESCAMLCQELCLPGLSIETARKVKNKADMIRAFEAQGVAHPFYELVNSPEAKIKIPFPVITKPVDKSGSRGINVATNAAELKEALLDSFSAGDIQEVIVEEYIDGPEVSVEILVQDGEPHILQVTDKLTTGAPHFIEIGHSQPSMLPSDCLDEIRKLAYDATKAVGVENGCCHAEIKMTQTGPKMIEIAGRQGGDFITTVLLPISTGVNMSEYEILRALGTPKKLEEKKGLYRSVAVRFIKASPGMLRSISLDYHADEMVGVEELSFVCKAGIMYGEAENNNDRFGYVIATGRTPQIAIDRCNTIIGRINIEMERECD